MYLAYETVELNLRLLCSILSNEGVVNLGMVSGLVTDIDR